MEIDNYFKEMFNIDIFEYPLKVQKGLIDIEENHNKSWVQDLYSKNKSNMNKRSIFYRGTNVTYKELFNTVECYASAFEELGLKEGMEVPVCMANCPEFVYVIMAVNLLGAKVNVFGSFNMDYLVEIINECDAEFIVCTDDQYMKINQAFSNSRKIIMFSLADSLINGKDPYIELDINYYDFKNRVIQFQRKDSRIIGKQDFLSYASSRVKQIEEYDMGNINAEFLITYSSGSTNPDRPKAIVHSNRSLITMGRFQDRDLSDLPNTKDLVGEALIPTYSNTDIITSISDVLYKACTVALEPIYNKNFFLDSILINKPNYVSAPRNMIVHAMKKLYKERKYSNFKMPYMMLLTSVGEPTSKGEEKFINKMMRKAKCGVGKLPIPFAPVPLSIGGGNCECGGLFFTPYRVYWDFLPRYLFTNKKIGLKQYHMVQTAIMNENGQLLPCNTIGRLVVKTPTAMKRYKNDEQATKDYFIKDTEGNLWADCKVYAAIDKYSTVKIYGRIGNEFILSHNKKIPLFLIGEVVEKDFKNILSYEVVNVNNTIIIHMEYQPDIKVDSAECLMNLEKKLNSRFGKAVSENIFYRIRTFEEGFEGNASEKRNYNVLVSEGITNQCVKPVYVNDKIRILDYESYIRDK
ncbi:MAG: long-chain fatty acid--CoA ligase [Roseburia sp.]|nr:long-chain fatty acid--CoA ligase [Roseburia sp.]